MKSTTFARLALFFPYLILAESILYFVYHDLDARADGIQLFNSYWNFFAIFWFVPHTILTFYLLIWSRGKTNAEIKSQYTIAPFIMMFISIGVYLIIFFIGLVIMKDAYEFSSILGFASVISIPASLIIGYAFVGFSLLMYKFFQKINRIRD